jgi:hypothetical protein
LGPVAPNTAAPRFASYANAYPFASVATGGDATFVQIADATSNVHASETAALGTPTTTTCFLTVS